MAKEENLFEEKAKEEGGKPAANTDKLKALRAAMDKIEKNYGKGSIMKLGDENEEKIVSLLQKHPDGIQINTLVVESNIAINRMTGILFELEMKGIIRTLAGGVYKLI